MINSSEKLILSFSTHLGRNIHGFDLVGCTLYRFRRFEHRIRRHFGDRGRRSLETVPGGALEIVDGTLENVAGSAVKIMQAGSLLEIVVGGAFSSFLS